MNYLWLLLIRFLFLTVSSGSDITGYWLGDWQNTLSNYCCPYALNIIPIDSNTYNITYIFTQQIISKYCYGYNVNDVSLTLILNSTNIWTDGYDSELVYDPQLNIITYPFFLYDTPPMIYEKNGTPLPKNEIQNVQGVWYNATQVDPLANTSNCCIPDNMFIVPSTYYNNQVTVTLNYTSTNCSDTGSSSFIMFDPNPRTLNWSAFGGFYNRTYYSQNIYFSPIDSPNQIRYTPNDSDASCLFYYQKYNQLGMISGQWTQDWQSLPDNFYPPMKYQITNVNNSFMTSTIITNVENTSSTVVQTLGGYYYDANFGYYALNFTLDEKTNIITGVLDRPGKYSMLFTPNGSLFSATPFISYWGNPQSTDSSPLPSDCCVPSVLNISNSTRITYGLQATYYFTQDLAANPACQDLISEVEHGTIITQISTPIPNISQLVWTDEYNNQIFFVNTSTTSEITVSNFFNQCSFNMVQIQSPSPPVPLYSALVSYISVYFVFALSMLFVCI